MPFSQLGIGNISLELVSSELRVSWTTDSQNAQCFQVYVDRVLKWQGYTRYCFLPVPSGSLARNTWVEVGAVPPSEAFKDYASSLTAGALGGDCVNLSWLGGTYLDSSSSDSVAGYKIFGSLGHDASVLSTNLGDVSAYPGSWISDGFGMGFFGQGGFGKSPTLYSWVSNPLSAGVWSFVVTSYNLVGDLGATSTPLAVAVQSFPPAPQSSSLSYLYSGSTTRQIQFHWNSSDPSRN